MNRDGTSKSGRRLPADLTGAEGREWMRLKEAGESVTLMLSDGGKVTGKIRYVDLSVISMATEDGTKRLIRKAEVKCVSLDEEAEPENR